ncbi:hypothetical protein ACIBCD_12135 [Nocardia brasiliensis]|uniref:hypothetical protein n=1 Tax=Nocardia brasiliensis TaxID=37326 RepID=UPI0037AE699D
MARLIPERTVDSLFAAEVLRHDPFAMIWSPSQRARTAVDHAITLPGGRLAVFECKAVDASSDGRRWTASVDLDQLQRYVDSGVPVLYLFLVKPRNVKRPDDRQCRIGRCVTAARCLSCCTDTRSHSAHLRRVMSAPAVLRLQPWFCHWSWVVQARDLRALLPGSDAVYESRLRLDDTWLFENFSYGFGVTRLCHFLEGVMSNVSSWVEPIDQGQVLELLASMSWPSRDELRDESATLPIVTGFSAVDDV